MCRSRPSVLIDHLMSVHSSISHTFPDTRCSGAAPHMTWTAGYRISAPRAAVRCSNLHASKTTRKWWSSCLRGSDGKCEFFSNFFLFRGIFEQNCFVCKQNFQIFICKLPWKFVGAPREAPEGVLWACVPFPCCFAWTRQVYDSTITSKRRI